MAEFDLSNFLKDSSVADLDWLDIDEEAYRESEDLPKQNLDVQPDLEALWARNDEDPTSYLVPNTGPNTMGDLSQVHGPLRPQAETIRRISRLALMQSSDPSRLRSELIKRIGSVEILREHRQVLAEVLTERGLLGPLYVMAEDFPTCARGGRAAEFVKRYARDARYVIAKDACQGCRHVSSTAGSTNHCGIFHKQLELEVPYSNSLADAIERAEQGKGRAVQAVEGVDPRERIRGAFLAPRRTRPSETYEGQGISRTRVATVDPALVKEQLVSVSALTRKKQAEVDGKPVVAFLHREMVKGLTREELVRSLKLAFSSDLLVRTRDQWQPIFREAGLYGVIYTKQASFESCHKGADFLAKHNPGVRAVVAGEKCGSCIYNKTRCMLYGKRLVQAASDVLTEETVEAVLQEHKLSGRLNPWDVKTASSWGETPAKALKAIHDATREAALPQVAPARMGFMEGFYGQRLEHSTGGITRRDIARQASRYMNEGLYGEDLVMALKTRYEVRDLVAAKEELRPILAEQGLQGIFYVDPSVYDDYGRGCDEAARLHRSRGLGYVKQGSKCDSCVHQTRLGFCSKIHKRLVVEPPYTNKAAQQREVLASGRSMEVTYESLVNNATNTVAEFQMQHELDVSVREAADPDLVTIQFGTGKVRL
jgi:hypothetical protein